MALFTQASIERVKEAADIVEVVSAYTDLRRGRVSASPGCARFTTSARRRSRSNATREALPLLRLRGGRRRDQVRRGEGGAGVRRGGRGARGALRGRDRARGGGSARRGGAKARGRGWARCSSARRRSTRSFLWDADEAAKAREYLALARAGRGGAARVRGRAMRRAPGTRCSSAARARGYSIAELDGGRAAGEEQAGQSLRPLPLADHVPDPRRARAGAGVRRAGDDAGPEAEVPELAGGGALPQEPHALCDRAGAAGDREGGQGGGRGGVHGRARRAPGGDRARRWR